MGSIRKCRVRTELVVPYRETYNGTQKNPSLHKYTVYTDNKLSVGKEQERWWFIYNIHEDSK